MYLSPHPLSPTPSNIPLKWMTHVWDAKKQKTTTVHTVSDWQSGLDWKQGERQREREKELKLSFKGNVHLDKSPGLSSKAVMWMKNWEALTQHMFYGLHLYRGCGPPACKSAFFPLNFYHLKDHINVNHKALRVQCVTLYSEKWAIVSMVLCAALFCFFLTCL